MSIIFIKLPSSLFFHLLCPLPQSQIHCLLFFNFSCYTPTEIYKYNSISLFIVTNTHMYLCLTIWDWITYQGAHPWRRLIFLLSATLFAAFHPGLELLEIFPIHVAMSSDVLIVWSCRLPYYWLFMATASCWYKTQPLTPNFLFVCLLQHFHSLFWNVACVLGVNVVF